MTKRGAAAIVSGVVALACVAALTVTQRSRAMPVTADECVGTWTGTGVQPGFPPWSIVLVVTRVSGTGCGTIEYPSLHCGGVLARCERRGQSVHFVERYTHNPGTCAPAGVIDASCRRTTMEWLWSGEQVVRSVLRRR